jgi:hypothetical protein
MIFVCLHFVVERGPISAMFYFENSLYLEVVTVVQGRGFLSKNDDAAATRQRYAAIVMRLVLRCLRKLQLVLGLTTSITGD